MDRVGIKNWTRKVGQKTRINLKLKIHKKCSIIAKNQRHYANEFKQQMVDLYNKSSKSIVDPSGEYGLPKSTLHKWIKIFSPIKGSDENISFKDYEALQKQIQEFRSCTKTV